MIEPSREEMPKRPKFKHSIKQGKICRWPSGVGTPEEVANRVKYSGSTIHKSYPSPAGPPALRADESKCDQFAEADWPKLREALQAAIRAEFVGRFRGSFPERVWVWINDVLHEARLTNEVTGEYHGFPINDPIQYPEPIERLKEAPRVAVSVI